MQLIKIKIMKKIALLTILLLSTLANAQSPIISLQAFDNNSDQPSGAYIKDLNNYYTPFLGIWKWESGNNSLEIKFEKISMVYDGEFYFDEIIGKFKYVKDGVTLHNSLNYSITNSSYWGYLYYIFKGSGYLEDFKIFTRFYDIHKKQHLNAFFELINPLTLNNILVADEIKMTTSIITQLDLNDTHNSEVGLNYPAEIILTKQ
jgi:hypothetical protein